MSYSANFSNAMQREATTAQPRRSSGRNRKMRGSAAHRQHRYAANFLERAFTKRRRDEEFARETFHEFLQGRGEAPLWEVGSEPPDYFLELGGQRYGVEVTQVMNEFLIGRKAQTSSAIQSFLLKVAKSIEDEARNRGILRGTYNLSAKAVENFGSIQDAVIEQALRYIEQTHDLRAAPAERIRTIRGKSWYIRKLEYPRDWVACTTSTSTNVDENSPVSVASLLRKPVEGKVKRLAAIRLPNILLLLDAFGLPSWKTWRAASQCLDTSSFHTVARVTGDRRVQILTSREERWHTNSETGDAA